MRATRKMLLRRAASKFRRVLRKYGRATVNTADAIDACGAALVRFTHSVEVFRHVRRVDFTGSKLHVEHGDGPFVDLAK